MRVILKELGCHGSVDRGGIAQRRFEGTAQKDLLTAWRLSVNPIFRNKLIGNQATGSLAPVAQTD